MVTTFRVLALSTALFAATRLTVGGADALPRATPESVGLSSSRLREATDLLRRFVAERTIAGAVAAVARNGQLATLEQELHLRPLLVDETE
jgi:hypothetical protein